MARPATKIAVIWFVFVAIALGAGGPVASARADQQNPSFSKWFAEIGKFPESLVTAGLEEKDVIHLRPPDCGGFDALLDDPDRFQFEGFRRFHWRFTPCVLWLFKRLAEPYRSDGFSADAPMHDVWERLDWRRHPYRVGSQWEDIKESVFLNRLERVRHRQNQKGDSQGSQKVIQAMRWVKGGQPWMTRPYSEDLRERVVRVVESGTSRNAAAKQFDVSISFVVKLMQRWKQRGTIKADKYGGWKKSKLAPHGDRIRALVMENCDITIDELCVLLAAEGIEAKRSTLGDFLLAQGLSRKKRQPTPPSRSALTSRRREPLGATSNLG